MTSQINTSTNLNGSIGLNLYQASSTATALDQTMAKLHSTNQSIQEEAVEELSLLLSNCTKEHA